MDPNLSPVYAVHGSKVEALKVNLSPVFALGFGVLFAFVAVEGRGAEPETIDSDNWTVQAGFAPDLSLTSCPEGLVVRKGKTQPCSGWLPDGLRMLIEKNGLKLRVGAYRPVHPSAGYLAATNAQRGKAHLVDTGAEVDRRGISGYEAGLPFPNPQNGLEVAWNFHYTYGGDDMEAIYGVYWISGESGLEHSEQWKLSMIRATGRTDVEPIPEVASLAQKGLQGAGMTYALKPYDKKGFGALYFKSVDPKDGQGHTYVPSMRRVIKNSFGTRGDTWNATDLLFEDVRGYSGYPEWMNWKLIGKKTALMPMHAGIEIGEKTVQKTYDLKKKPHWNPRYTWEPRPVYVLEVTPKLPDYPYSKQILYVDAEAYHILYKESYDRKGALWKILINAATDQADEESGDTILAWGGTVVIDIQARHATIFHVHRGKWNLGLDPGLFTLSNLRKRSR